MEALVDAGKKPLAENCQDVVSVIPELAGQKQAVLLAVYDGHGMQGKLAAQYVSKKLPYYLSKHRHIFTYG